MFNETVPKTHYNRSRNHFFSGDPVAPRIFPTLSFIWASDSTIHWEGVNFKNWIFFSSQRKTKSRTCGVLDIGRCTRLWPPMMFYMLKRCEIKSSVMVIIFTNQNSTLMVSFAIKKKVVYNYISMYLNLCNWTLT